MTTVAPVSVVLVAHDPVTNQTPSWRSTHRQYRTPRRQVAPKRAAKPVDYPCESVDPDVFFTEYNPARVAQAKQLCRGCPRRTKCLLWALDSGEDWGVWGGLSDQERRELHLRPVEGPAPAPGTGGVKLP